MASLTARQDPHSPIDPARSLRTRVKVACRRCRRQKLKVSSQSLTTKLAIASPPLSRELDRVSYVFAMVLPGLTCLSFSATRSDLAPYAHAQELLALQITWKPSGERDARRSAIAFTATTSKKNSTIRRRPSGTNAHEYQGSTYEADELLPGGESRESRQRRPTITQTPELSALHFQHNPRDSSSVLGLTREILSEFGSNPDLESPTYALPGTLPPRTGADTQVKDNLRIRDLIGVDLPDRETGELLLGSYFSKVQWFMMVLHEQTFRAHYEALISSGRAHHNQLRQVALTLLVLAMGARYTRHAELTAAGLQVDLETLQSTFLAKVQENLFTILNEVELESVQICILLSSFYLYHGKPNLGFVILGTGIRSAHALDLHREAMWRKLTPVSREERKRVWWALYVFDRFAAMIFGRPYYIQDSEFQVSMVQNMEDTTSRHPTLSSMEMNEYGNSENVTIFSYQKHKFKLYQLSSQVIANVHFRAGVGETDVGQRVKDIHEQLVAWHANLPPELRLSKSARRHELPKSAIEMTFDFQALALQLAYDNIQILLHRPMLSGNARPSRTDTAVHEPQHIARSSPAFNDFPSGITTPQTSPSQSSISKAQCWASAIRTSELVNHKECLVAAIYTHASSYIGIHLFTAGMILTIVALSKPLSSQAQEAKRAISHIIRMLGWLEDRILLSHQSSKILEALVRLILEKEMKAILPRGRIANQRHGQGQEQDQETQNVVSVLDEASTRPLIAPRSIPLENHPSNPQHSQIHETSSFSRYETSLNDHANTEVGDDYSFDDPSFSGMDALQNTDFQEGITNVQQFMGGQYGAFSTTFLGADTLHDLPTSYTGNTQYPFNGNTNENFSAQAWLWDL
ncbi:hypothetical protein LTR84_009286 [Exophiala bonariae]|uniref:Xylanolytic transcriptional activator regulatory domain-containing protein n=1 Tax=Exophiala bonariae TaxID=1690606 RepID=A0AAV9MUZ5_9EURO|nr:hypothetical protein LTR84_009286 [Exophiala bonariae]